MKIENEIQYCVNENKSFKLKDIYSWCIEKRNYTLSEKILLYMRDNNLKSYSENEYYIKKISYKKYDKENEQLHVKYSGYYLKERENNDSLRMVQEKI